MAFTKITKTQSEIRDDLLRTWKNGAARQNVFLNVGPGTDPYIRAEGIALMASVILNNVEAAEEAKMPDTAIGADLDRLLDQYGLTRRAAAGSTGRVTITCSAATLVPIGSELSSPEGIIFRVTTGGTYSDGDTIPVASVDTGAASNLEEGTILRWSLAPAYTQPTASLSTASSGGVDVESDEVARQRLLSRLRHPPSGANWPWVKDVAENTDPSVQAAFVFSCCNGPGTVYVSVCAAPSTVNKTRVVNSTIMGAIVEPTILGLMPAGVETVVQTVVDVPTDVSFRLSLPKGTSAGYKDNSPWPQIDAGVYDYIAVSVVTDTSHITVVAPTAPTPGVSRICWVDRSEYTVKFATVSSYTGSSPNFALTLDAPLVGVAVGDWIMPASNYAQKYLDAVLNHFALMGPGEKTELAGLLPRAERKPLPAETYPNTVDSPMLKELNDSGTEVQTSDFYYRSSTSALTPASIDTAPNILIPRHIGFYS